MANLPGLTTLTATGAAKYLGISKTSLYRLRDKTVGDRLGPLPGITYSDGGCTRWTVTDLNAFLNGQRRKIIPKHQMADTGPITTIEPVSPRVELVYVSDVDAIADDIFRELGHRPLTLEESQREHRL